MEALDATKTTETLMSPVKAFPGTPSRRGLADITNKDDATPVAAGKGEQLAIYQDDEVTFKVPAAVEKTEAHPPLKEEQARMVVDEHARTIATRFHDLIMWNRPARSAGVLGSAFAAFYVTTFCGYTPLSVAAYATLARLMYFYVMNKTSLLLGRFGNKSKVTTTESSSTLVSADNIETMNHFVTYAAMGANKGYGWWKDVVGLKCEKKTVKVAFSLYLVAVLGSCFSLQTLLFIAFITSFFVPRVYVSNKDLIDARLRIFRAHSEVYLQNSKVIALDTLKNILSRVLATTTKIQAQSPFKKQYRAPAAELKEEKTE